MAFLFVHRCFKLSRCYDKWYNGEEFRQYIFMKKLIFVTSLMALSATSALAQYQNSGEEGWKPGFMSNDNQNRRSVEQYKEEVRAKRLAERIKNAQLQNISGENNVSPTDLQQKAPVPQNINQQLNTNQNGVNGRVLDNKYPDVSTTINNTGEKMKEDAGELKDKASEGMDKLKSLMGN